MKRILLAYALAASCVSVGCSTASNTNTTNTNKPTASASTTTTTASPTVTASPTTAASPTSSAVPEFTGAPSKQKEAFKAFIIKNVGKRVSLKLTFDDDVMPYGYRIDTADPIFEVDNFTYFFDCGEEMNAEWTTRCKKLNWKDDMKTINGYFNITEPDPETMRTNRSFHLTPTT